MARYSGKADPSLVEGAYRAAMANVPHDYSRVFERIANSYDRTMHSVNTIWNVAGKIGGQYLADAASGFKTRAKYNALGESFRNTKGVNAIMDGYTFYDQKDNPDFIYAEEESETNPKFITEETRIMGLNEIHSAIWDTYRKDPLKAFSAENKQLRNDLNLKATKIYSQIDILKTGFNNINNIINSRAYNQESAKHLHGDARLLAALGAFESSSGKVESGGMNNGDYLELGWDRNGDMIFNLFNEDGEGNVVPVLNDMLDLNSGQVSVPVEGIEDIIVKNDVKFTKNASALINRYIDNVTKSPKEVERLSRTFNNSFDNLITTENQLMHAIFEDKYSSFGSSMMDDMMDKSMFSATIFRTLLEDPNEFDENGTVIPNEATQELIDKGGINVSGGSNPDGLDVDDFAGDEIAAIENYTKLAAIYSNRRHPLYKEENTREALKVWISQKAGDQVAKNLNIAQQIATDKQNRLKKILTADQIQSNDILHAWSKNNFDGLVLKNRTDARSTGTIIQEENGDLFLEENSGSGDVIRTPIPRTNKGLQQLLYIYGGDHGVKIYDQLKKKGHTKNNLFGSDYNPDEFNVNVAKTDSTNT